MTVRMEAVGFGPFVRCPGCGGWLTEGELGYGFTWHYSCRPRNRAEAREVLRRARELGWVRCRKVEGEEESDAGDRD